LSILATKSADRSLLSWKWIKRMWWRGTAPARMGGTDRREEGTDAS
jgi:hypothetical protein